MNKQPQHQNKTHDIMEGPEWGAESASAYKAMTPGQENATQVPKTEETPTPDQIQKLVDIVAKRIMGLKESIVRYGTDWNNISNFIDMFGDKGIDYLVQMCEDLNERKGKPLRKLFEDVNPDEFIEEETVDEATLGGEKYKGKTNPNNTFVKKPFATIKNQLRHGSGVKDAAADRRDNAEFSGTFGNKEKNDRKAKMYDKVAQGKKAGPIGESHDYGEHGELVASAINHFGDHDHPAASKDNLHYFQKSYVKSVLQKASKHIHPDHKKNLDHVMKNLKEETVNEDEEHFHVHHDPKGSSHRSKKMYSDDLNAAGIKHKISNSPYSGQIRFSVDKKHAKQAEKVLYGED